MVLGLGVKKELEVAVGVRRFTGRFTKVSKLFSGYIARVVGSI